MSEPAWPAGRAWSRARRWAHPDAAAVVAAAVAAAPAWDPRGAVVIARSWAEADHATPELAALAAEHPVGADPAAVAALLHDELSDFAYLRSLPSLLGQHVARALGGCAQSLAVTSGWEHATALARRLVRSGEVPCALVCGTVDGRARAELVTETPTAAPGPVQLAGAGAVTALGGDADSTWHALVTGTTGVGTAAWLAGLPVAPAVGALDEATRRDVTARWSDRLGRDASLTDALTHDVCAQALAGSTDDGPLGLVLAPMWEGERGSDAAAWSAAYARGGAVATDPEHARLAAEVASRTGREVVWLAVEATCAGGLRALAEAARLVRTGEATEALAVAVVARNNPYHASQFAQLTALSRWAGDPAAASRPFAADRSGMVLGEAAAAVLVRAGDDGVLLTGTGVAHDHEHPTAPAPEHVERAVARALAAAQAEPTGLATISAHGTGTRLNDAAEAQALAAVMGPPLATTPVAALKAMTGHASAASGLLEAGMLARTLAEGTVPGVPTCATPDPALGVDVATGARALPDATVRAGLTTSFGFGGQYAAAVLTWSPRSCPAAPA